MTSKNINLCVQQTFSNKYIHNDTIYLKTGIFGNDIENPKIVTINGIYFNARYTDKSEADCVHIYMNLFQRQQMSLPLETNVSVGYPTHDDIAEIKHISSVELFVSAMKSIESPVDSEILVDRFKLAMNDMVIGSRPIMFVLDGVELKITPTKIFPEDSHILTLTTKLTLVGDPKKISLINNSTMDGAIFKQDINLESLEIGGLDDEFRTIFRRAFSSRMLSKKVMDDIGIHHVRGILLHGPPGCGKTLIARQIGKILNCKEPKIVRGPELLNKYVGSTEEAIRNLFKDAFADTTGQLHLIIFDEFDSICKKRGMSGDNTNVSDNSVNQLLSMIDGPDSLDNVLLICMTNRIDILDEAVMRPGRLEVIVEINLPDDKGRVQILKIHTSKMTSKGYTHDIDLSAIAQKTKNYTGAELEGVVKSALSYAIARETDMTDTKKAKDLRPMLTQGDFDRAVVEIEPMFGIASGEIERITAKPLLMWCTQIENIYNKIIQSINTAKNGYINVILVYGEQYTGKTKLVAHAVKNSNVACIKFVTPKDLINFADRSKHVNLIYDQCCKPHESVIVLDNMERIIEWSSSGARYDNKMVQTILTLVNTTIDPSKKITVIITANSMEVLELFDMHKYVDISYSMPEIVMDDAHSSVLLNMNPSACVGWFVPDLLRSMKYN